MAQNEGCHSIKRRSPSYRNVPIRESSAVASAAKFTTPKGCRFESYLRSQNKPFVSRTTDRHVAGCRALLNSSVVGTWALTSFTPFTLETAAFTASTGSETLEFEGLATGDHTAFLSDVAISTAPEPSSLAMVIIGAALLAGFVFRSRRLVSKSVA